MAQLIETVAVIKISKLIKDDEPYGAEQDAEIFKQLQAVAEELAGPQSLVELVIDQS